MRTSEPTFYINQSKSVSVLIDESKQVISPLSGGEFKNYACLDFKIEHTSSCKGDARATTEQPESNAHTASQVTLQRQPTNLPARSETPRPTSCSRKSDAERSFSFTKEESNNQSLEQAYEISIKSHFPAQSYKNAVGWVDPQKTPAKILPPSENAAENDGAVADKQKTATQTTTKKKLAEGKMRSTSLCKTSSKNQAASKLPGKNAASATE